MNAKHRSICLLNTYSILTTLAGECSIIISILQIRTLRHTEADCCEMLQYDKAGEWKGWNLNSGGLAPESVLTPILSCLSW